MRARQLSMTLAAAMAGVWLFTANHPTVARDAEARDAKQTLGNDLAVGDDDDSVGIGFAEKVLGLEGADFFGLEDGDVCAERDFFYW